MAENRNFPNRQGQARQGGQGQRSPGHNASGGGRGPSNATALRPLYQGHGDPNFQPGSSHGGLWFDRFYNAYHWKEDRDGKTLDIQKSVKDKRDRSLQDLWLDELTKSRLGDPDQLKAYRDRMERLVKARGGQTLTLKTDWNFVTGMGLPHPLENGMAWHPTLGVPYLAGSGVKGLLRAFFEEWVEHGDGEGQVPEDTISRWFGPDLHKHPKADPQAGEFIFFDAFPVKQPQLTQDVMTPHMGKWYAEGGKIALEKGRLPPDKVPADWHDPNPIKFLAVKQATLLFAIAPRKPTAAKPEDLKLLMQGLEEALRWLGAGAKTAVGYGRFSLLSAEN